MAGQERENAEKNQEILNELFNQGIIDAAGTVLV